MTLPAPTSELPANWAAFVDGISAGLDPIEAARGAGIAVDTIGLGTDVDGELLRNMASSPDRYHEAPDAEDLASIFARMTFFPQPCRLEPAWPGSGP